MHGSTLRRGAITIATALLLFISATPFLSAAHAAVVTTAPTTVKLTTTKPSAPYGAAGKFNVVVKPVALVTGVVTGMVDLFADGEWFSRATLDGLGKASVPLSALYPTVYPGTYSITAVYGGDANFDPSTSAAVA